LRGAAGFAQGINEARAIDFIAKNLFPTIAPVERVIDCSAKFHSRFASHR
jgi:hypothetical protein